MSTAMPHAATSSAMHSSSVAAAATAATVSDLFPAGSGQTAADRIAFVRRAADWMKTNECNAVQYGKLSNGFSVATMHLPHLTFGTYGVYIDAGSRYETRANNGTAHFLEHLLFKGTKHFTKQEIDMLFESTGSHFNAYTSRDRTAYYVKCFNEHAEACIRCLSDILQYSHLRERDISDERGTIMAELNHVESIVDEVIMDQMHAVAFDSSTSGLPLTILGFPDMIQRGIDRDMMTKFTETHYTGPRMTLVSVGGMRHEEAMDIAERHFGKMPSVSNRPPLTHRYVGGDSVMWNSRMLSSNLVWAIPICGASHEDNYALQVAHCAIGGYQRDSHDVFVNLPRFNSRFVTEPALDRIQPFYTPYEEVSLFGFNFVTVPGDGSSEAGGATSVSDHSYSTLQRVVDSNVAEWIRMAYEPLSQERLDDVKAIYLAAQTMLLDNSTNLWEDLGRQTVHFGGRRRPDWEVAERILAVTAEDVMRVMKKYIVGSRPSVAFIGHPKCAAGYDALLDVAFRTSQPRATI